MIYDFLKDFHRRAEIIAIVDFMTTRISRKTKLREYGFDSAESINLVMLVVCFIMEKSLIEETCTKSDVALFIRRMDIDYIKKNIPDEEYMNIADYIIKDCLQNSGIPHYFATYNFESNKEEKINVKLIDDKRITMESESTYSYYMTPQGYKFMFNTLEIEDAMQVSIEQFKLSLSIKKRNFNAARNNADSLFNISKTQIQRINYFIKRVKEDIGNAGIEEYERIYNGTFSSINEQKEGYENLYELIGKVEKSFAESNDVRNVKDALSNAKDTLNKENLTKEIESISYIKGRLKSIISEQSQLLLKQQELQKIYNEAVDNILYIGFENRMSFEDVVVKKLEKNPHLAYPLIKILRPLFRPDVNKILNIGLALKEQRIASNEVHSEGSNILMSEKYFNKFESENDLKIRDINQKYLNIFECICDYTLQSTDNEILLSKIIEKATSEVEYHRLVPDIKVLTNVLLQLTSIKEVDFAMLKSQRVNTVFNPSESFDVKYCVLKMLSGNQVYNKIQSMQISLSRNKKIFISERLTSMSSENAFENCKGLSCPDILFKIGAD